MGSDCHSHHLNIFVARAFRVGRWIPWSLCPAHVYTKFRGVETGHEYLRPQNLSDGPADSPMFGGEIRRTARFSAGRPPFRCSLFPYIITCLGRPCDLVVAQCGGCFCFRSRPRPTIAGCYTMYAKGGEVLRRVRSCRVSVASRLANERVASGRIVSLRVASHDITPHPHHPRSIRCT